MSRLKCYAIGLALLLACAKLGAQSVQYVSPAGVRYLSFPDTSTAIRAARERYRREPSVPNAIALGTTLSGARQFREAVQTFNDAIGRFPGSALLYRWRGHRHLTLRDFTRAAIDLETAIGLDSTLYGAWYHLGIVRFANGQFDDAVRAFRAALPLAPDPGERAGSVDWLWMSLSRAGRTAEARALLAARPDSIPVDNAYARRLRLYRGEIGPADVIGPADTADVQRSTLAFGVGQWHYLRGDSTLASTWYRTAIDAGGWPGFGFIISETELSGRSRLSGELRNDRLALRCVVPPDSAPRREVRALIEWPELPQDTGAVREARRRAALVLVDIARIVRFRLQPFSQTLPAGDSLVTWRQLQGTLTLTLRRDSTYGVLLPALSPYDVPRSDGALGLVRTATDSLIQHAPKLHGLPTGFVGDSITARVVLEADGDTPAIPESLRRLRPVARVPLFTLAVPRLTHASLTSDSPAPPYPRGLASGFRLGVIATFAVDTTGRVIEHSFREEWSPRLARFRGQQATVYDRFVQSLVESLPSLRFTPASLAGCPVREAVQQAFVLGAPPG